MMKVLLIAIALTLCFSCTYAEASGKPVIRNDPSHTPRLPFKPPTRTEHRKLVIRN